MPASCWCSGGVVVATPAYTATRYTNPKAAIAWSRGDRCLPSVAVRDEQHGGDHREDDEEVQDDVEGPRERQGPPGDSGGRGDEVDERRDEDDRDEQRHERRDDDVRPEEPGRTRLRGVRVGGQDARVVVESTHCQSLGGGGA